VKILLFGKNGQIGWELQRSLSPLGELVTLGSSSADGAAMSGDFRDLEGIARAVALVRPDVVVNAAAYTAVDKAQAEPLLAAIINASAPCVLAQAANACGAMLVHYSTDYVFDGTGDRPWGENDAPAPLNVYGQTKLEGERLIALYCPRHLIMRTSWVYGARGSNFAKTMLRLAGEREQLNVIDDQFGAPTGAELLADVTAHAISALLTDSVKGGLYHVAAAGVTSWHAYASFVIEYARAAGVAIKCPSDGIKPIPSSALVTAARRPGNSRLDCSRFTDTFSLRLAPWQQGVSRMLNEIL
jgi:dTDP-4-dehydrorhamnose reductase